MSKKKRSEVIHDALQYLDDEMIEDVEKLRGVMKKEDEKDSTIQNKKSFIKTLKQKAILGRKGATLAASVCIFFVGAWVYEAYIQPSDQQQNQSIEEAEEDILLDEADRLSYETDKLENEADRLESAKEESLKDDYQSTVGMESLRKGVSIPRMEVSLKMADDAVATDMLGFFILNGRSYIQYEFQWDYKEKGADFVGDYVGHVSGMIDEWSEIDGYVDGAGTYIGDVYEVKGVSPEFMLCMVWEDGSVETFINHNDITLYKGADLVDDWLDLRGNYEDIALEVIVDHKFSFETLELTEEERKVFDRFLDAFAEGDYVYVEEKIEHPFGGDWDTPDMLDFYFVKENGVLLRFRTLGDGYVSFPWIRACVRIEQNIYDEVVEILQRQVK